MFDFNTNMNININKLKYTLPMGLIAAGVISIGVIADIKRPKNTTAEDIQNAKMIVRKHNPDKYIETLENNDCLKGWLKASKEVEDSLRIDSLCKKAYFEGAKMVRDTINSKNIIKSVK